MAAKKKKRHVLVPKGIKHSARKTLFARENFTVSVLGGIVDFDLQSCGHDGDIYITQSLTPEDVRKLCKALRCVR